MNESDVRSGKSRKKRRKRRVKEPLTEELLEELLSAPSPAAFADGKRLKKRSLSEYLQQLLDEKGLERVDVIHAADLNETYGYQLFAGQRANPSRNKVIQLAFAMKCTLREANRLMQAAGVNGLYPKNRRDAIIIFCLDRGCSLHKTDEELYRFGEETIC